MRVIECPNTDTPKSGERSLFLAGGITDCPDWQQEMIHLLADTSLTLLNPRRQHFPIDDPSAAEVQIRWEHHYLRLATEILFWFPCETLCPIALYELGAWTMTDKLLYIGVHPNYRRRQDIELQTQLTRPDVSIDYSLAVLAQRVKASHGG